MQNVEVQKQTLLLHFDKRPASQDQSQFSCAALSLAVGGKTIGALA
jgi:hypothetical protein